MKLLPMLCAALILTGCATVNAPTNQPLPEGQNAPLAQARDEGEVYVGLAFSGGGMRASAFAYGLLEELRAQTANADDPDGVLSEVRLVTGVSGGSVTAAYFGLHGPAALEGYRENYLVTDAEKYMANSPLNPLTLVRGVSGGANGRRTFGRYLDERLFHGATFGDLRQRSGITTWINASDMANQTPFLFSPETFDALCSDLSGVPISDAVAASAAFPLVFAPIVLEAHQGKCDYQEPDWLTAARHNPEATAAMKAHAAALDSYGDPEKVKYVKLLDGGITDNFGTTGLAIERARARNGYAPMSAEQAVRLKRFLFLVADAGTEKTFRWSQKKGGPGGMQLAMGIAGASMGAASRTGYDAMRLQLEKWQADLVEFRCSLPSAQVRKLRGSLAGWNCKDVKFFVGLVSFDALDQDRRTELNEIPTRLRLKTEQVDMAIEAGRMAARLNPDLNGFLRAAPGHDPLAALKTRAGTQPRRIAPVKN
ncbi:patatin-like phospholipase family protein [Thalassovita sp.]|uniref:patatin-like phospholipase family protein n=1 Tax=Thalassovita sp. TaxID=1979401 RepID=UPI0029DE895F|nr:patatin-like phospholipase family protein [Thalassovita sp.]